jgi:hypothetical protein
MGYYQVTRQAIFALVTSSGYHNYIWYQKEGSSENATSYLGGDVIAVRFGIAGECGRG